MERTKILLTVALACTIALLSGVHYSLLTNGVRYEYVAIASPNGHTISATLATPTRGNLSEVETPGIVVFHGFIASKEWMIQLVFVLSRLGYRVLSIDQPGHGGNSELISSDRAGNREDGLTALEYLRNEVPGVDSSTIGAIGFSMGGSTTQQVARADGNLTSIVVMGNTIICFNDNSTGLTVSPSFPRNVLNVVGVIDELFSPARAKDAMECLIDAKDLDNEGVETGKMYGDIAAGTARKLQFTASDHVFGAIEPLAIDASARWFLETLPLPDSVKLLTDSSDGILLGGNALGLEFLSGLIGFVWLVGSFALFFSMTAIEVDYDADSSSIHDITEDLEKHDSSEMGEASHPSKTWWIFHGLLIVLSLGVSFLLDSFMSPQLCLSFGGTFLFWLIILPVAFAIWLSCVREFEFTKGVIQNAYLRLLPSAERSSFKFLVFFLVWVFIIQAILYNLPFAYSFATPLLKSFAVAGSGGSVIRRIGTFIIIWSLSTPTFILEAELVRLRVGHAFTFRNVLSVVMARCWVLLLVIFVIIITNFALQLRIFGLFSFLVLMIYPATGLFVIASVLTQYARSQGHGTMTVSLLFAGLLALLLSSVLPFEQC